MVFVENEFRSINNVKVSTLMRYGLFAEYIENATLEESRAIRKYLDSLGLKPLFNKYHTQIQELNPVDLSEYERSISSPKLDSIRESIKWLNALCEQMLNDGIEIDKAYEDSIRNRLNESKKQLK